MKRLSLLLILFVSISCLNVPQLYAQSQQPSVAQLQQIEQELQKRGLTEAEVRTRLIQRGIDIDQIPPTELPQYQKRIMAVIEELEAEKKAQQAAQKALAETEKIPDDVQVSEAVAEAGLRVVQESIEERNIYGHGLFTNQSLAVFRTTDGAKAPETYILGAGDQIRITIFGTSQADMLLEINAEGYIQPTDMPKIFLQGVTLANARSLLQRRFSSFYTFRPEQFAITIQTARTITVNVFGESMLKGSFTVSALNTAFNALAAAGGPTAIGSVRNIQLIRGDTRKTMDVYAFMNNPSVQFQFDLQHNDIIHVPVARKRVSIAGAVQRPMRYELTDNESLLDLINFAGGISADAYPDFVQIQRYENGEVSLKEYDLSTVLSGSQRIALQNGDIITLRRVNANIQQQLSSAGSVYYPGSFGFKPGMTVGDLIKLSGGTTPSASDMAYIVRRELSDTTRAEYFPVDITTNTGLQFELRANDMLTVYDRTLYSNIGDVRITGAVKLPAEFIFSNDLTLADVFKAAGGFDVSAALNRVEVFRTNIFPDRPITLEQITLELNSNYQVTGGDMPDFRLKPYDQIVVRQTPGFQLQRTVELNGEVQYPGVYVLESRETQLSEIIQQAGGLRNAADPNGIRLFRTFNNRGFIISDLSEATKGRSDQRYDPILFEGDVITIPRRENTVSIRPTGVRFAETVDPEMVDAQMNLTYQGSKNAKWYIKNYAGGFERKADKRSVTVTLKSGQVISTQRVLFFRKYPTVEPGSTISLRMKPEPPPGEEKKTDWDQVINRTMQVTTTMVTLLLLSRQL